MYIYIIFIDIIYIIYQYLLLLKSQNLCTSLETKSKIVRRTERKFFCIYVTAAILQLNFKWSRVFAFSTKKFKNVCTNLIALSSLGRFI